MKPAAAAEDIVQTYWNRSSPVWQAYPAKNFHYIQFDLGTTPWKYMQQNDTTLHHIVSSALGSDNSSGALSSAAVLRFH